MRQLNRTSGSLLIECSPTSSHAVISRHFPIRDHDLSGKYISRSDGLRVKWGLTSRWHLSRPGTLLWRQDPDPEGMGQTHYSIVPIFSFFFFYLRYSCLQKYGVARLFFFFSQCVWFRAWGSMVDTVFLGSWAIGWFLGRMFFP